MPRSHPSDDYALRRKEEEDLVRRLRARDQDAFREFVERYQSRVFTMIYGTLRNREDAEDIAQQVFAKVWAAIGDFDHRGSLLTWTYRITVHECYDWLRKKRVRKLVYESEFSEEDWEQAENSPLAADPRVAFDRTLAHRDVAVKLLSRLTPHERELILLREVEGYSIEELAGLTGLNENTIKVKLFRTRQKLLAGARRLNRPCRPGFTVFPTKGEVYV